MLFRLIKKIFSRPPAATQAEPQSALEKGMAFQQAGDARSAIIEFRKHLESFPNDMWALNNLGCCLNDIGDHEGAGKCYERAFILDDSFLPIIINHAKYLCDAQRSEEAMEFLRQAKTSDPDFPNVDAVFGGTALAKGNPELARKHALRAWLTSFDTLRFANCYLFYCAYCDMSESQLAAEHFFWGETLLPLPATEHIDGDSESEKNFQFLPKIKGKIRIAYWSPDFRSHSVRYFFRPLLENHDREKFEIILYHDFPLSDAQTDNIKACADHFFPVSDLPDHKLLALMHSHQLDILVELAGHSSSNRINLLQEKLADLQISGLGYPPTTGLRNIDAKIIDSHIADIDSSKFYAETPMVLPSSFWCFDPKESSDINETPPVIRNGHITFACVGNIAKINIKLLKLWSEILRQVQGSKLLLRSISFNDKAAQEAFRQKLYDVGISLDRVEILGPAAGKAYFESYNDIDIILDTHPFNGGTTTCFAAYMGVPVVSLVGESLISRMGQSILSNLGLADWVVKDEKGYIERAIEAAKDIDFLHQFRADTRARFSQTALGNGALFAKEFEAACISMLEAKLSGNLPKADKITALPAEEILQRAYAVLRTGQIAAAKRIVDHCLSVYPDCGAAHILATQELTTKGLFVEAAHYLEERLSKFAPSEQVAALINITRNHLLADQIADARRALERAHCIDSDDPYDHMQLRIMAACLSARNGELPPLAISTLENMKPVSIDILIPCDDIELFQTIQSRINTLCQQSNGLSLRFIQCSETRKSRAYAQVFSESKADIFLWHQKNIEICNHLFFQELIKSLQRVDIIGIAGARLWERLDWRLSNVENKAASFMIPSEEKAGCYELQTKGFDRDTLATGMSVLDGSLMAIHRRSLELLGKPDFDQLLESGAALMEEDFSHQAYKAGARLAVHQGLGIVMDWRIPLQNKHLGEARWHLSQRFGFDPFMQMKDDRTIISVPVKSSEEGLTVQRILFQRRI